MAGTDYHENSYIRELNDYHTRLASCGEVCAFLMDRADEFADEEWHKAACFLMRDMLRDLTVCLPFPPEESMKLGGEVQS